MTAFFLFLRALPNSVKMGIGGLALVLSFYAYHTRIVNNRDKQITELGLELRQAKVANTEITANRDSLVRVIEEQNQAVLNLQKQGQAKEARAATAVVRTVRERDARVETLLVPVPAPPRGTTNHEEVNAWIAKRFSRP